MENKSAAEASIDKRIEALKAQHIKTTESAKMILESIESLEQTRKQLASIKLQREEAKKAEEKEKAEKEKEAAEKEEADKK